MNALATSNQVNFMASAGHTIRFADFRLQEATQYMNITPRPYQQELALCQRHYQKSYNISEFAGTVTSSGRFGFNAVSVNNGAYLTKISFPVVMNDIPSIVLYSDTTGTSGKANGAAGDYNAIGTDANITGFCPVNNSGANQPGLFCQWTAAVRLR